MADRKKLLFMDDDPVILRLVCSYFKNRGFDVQQALNGAEGLLLFEHTKPDVVLTDLRMPVVDGFKVLETITVNHPDVPVIVISGEGEMADVIQALRWGACNYHTKPIENLLLIEYSVEQALEKARLLRENRAYQQGLETRLWSIVNNYSGFILTCDKECRVTYANPSLQNHYGENIIGAKCHEVVMGIDVACPWCSQKNLLSGKEEKHEIHNSRDNRWYYVIQTPVFDQKGNLLERQIVLHDITERKQKLLDIQESERQLRKENQQLRASLTDRYRFGDIIGRSKAMQEVYEAIINAAASDANVIIYGESGTGKELVAQAIHKNSDRKDKALTYVNCGAIPENLFESEFFGYKKGAFTGADRDKPGLLDLSDGGILFLDEVGEIPLNMQIKFLRAIEGGGFSPVGGMEIRKPDVRIMAATNRDLKEAVRHGLMRQDFFYRIHVIPVYLPPLRERKEDIRFLVEYFLAQYEKKTIPPFTSHIRKALQSYDWPGNVRELQNTIHRFVTMKKLDFMNLDLTDPTMTDNGHSYTLQTAGRPLQNILVDFEKEILLRTLEENLWHQGQTAEILEIAPKTLYRKMKQLGIEKPDL